MKNSMRKIKIIMLICSFFLLSSCGEETLSEEDLVDGRTIGAEQGVEDVEAGNFPLFWGVYPPPYTPQNPPPQQKRKEV